MIDEPLSRFSADGILALDTGLCDAGNARSAFEVHERPIETALDFLLDVSNSRRDRQILMNQRDDGRALPDRRADALHRARAHVADGEHAWHARLEPHNSRRDT